MGDLEDPRRPRRDPRERPADPAGTQPKHDPSALLPSSPLAEDRALDGVVEGHAVEEGHAAVDDAGPIAAVADGGDLLPERRAAGGVGAVRDRVPPPHAPRFHFLYGALAALAAAALAAGAIALISGGGGAQDRVRAIWSPWKPTESSVAGATQIASHVGPKYRLSDGRQLVQVEASTLAFEGIPLSVAVRETAAQGGDIRVFSESGLIYRLCGLGTNCSISSGKPSTQRHLLLQREALELALYSFRYLDGVDQVVVLMPPPPGQKPSEAVFFRRGDVGRQLDRPLAASLSARTPTVGTITVSPDRSLVERLTGIHTFSFSLTQANTANRGFLVLDPRQPSR